jgi:hypothetical protein
MDSRGTTHGGFALETSQRNANDFNAAREVHASFSVHAAKQGAYRDARRFTQQSESGSKSREKRHSVSLDTCVWRVLRKR